MALDQINVGIIGTGWCGGIRAESCADNPLIDQLHIAEINPQRLEEIAKATGAATATSEYQRIVEHGDIDAVIISATPETTHYPMAKESLLAGKHVFLEKPIALSLEEADDLIAIAKQKKVKFTIGYSQRFNPKIAYAKKSIADGTLGTVVNVMVSRHLSRNLGKKIANRVKLSPVAMESTHDLDFVFWLLAPAKPVRVYSQGAYGYMKELNGSYDCMWSTVTMDDDTLVVVGGGWNLPPSYPNYCGTWIEITGTEGALILDDTSRDNWMNTVSGGTQYPMSTMPGEHVDHVFAGQMGPETIHFLEAVLTDRPVMVAPEHARMVMEAYSAADVSAELNEPINLPMSNHSLAALADLKAAQRGDES